MPRRPYDLPPMRTLVAFEAAARHGSFKGAAEELNVTPGAISHQIRALEGDLGCALFERVHRGVLLSEPGEALFGVLRGAFQSVAGELGRLRARGDEPAITVSATTAVSALWLTPRLMRFWREHPHIPVNQIVSDHRAAPGGAADLSVIYHEGDVPPAGAQPLFRDTLVPLAAPSFAAAHVAPDLGRLAALPLIHLKAEGQSWTTWRGWFGALGHDGPLHRGITVNNYMIALQAARDGAGVVLGWKTLVAPLLESGALVVLGDAALPAPGQFYVQRGPRMASDDPAAMLERWLLADT